MASGMPPSRWRYTAAASDGSTVSGEIDAATERDAVDALRRRALWAVDLAPLDARRAQAVTRATTGRSAYDADANTESATADAVGGRAPWLSTFSARWRGTADADLAVTVRAISTLLAAGVPLSRTLNYAERSSTSLPHRQGFGRLYAAVQRGESLSAAVASVDAFPVIFAPLIAAGEGSGTLDASVALLATYLERRDALRTRIQSALVYPALLAIASVAGLLVILIVVVPRFAGLIFDSGGMLPWSTRVLMGLSTAVVDWWWLLALLAGVAALTVDRGRRNAAWQRRWHATRLRWPWIGTFERTHAAARYTGTLAVGLRAGVPLLTSMSLARAVVTNQQLAARLADAEVEVRQGSSLSSAISGLLPSLSERLLEAGEVSGDLAGMAARAGDAADEALQRTLTQGVALIEPILILGFGGLVGFVALALLQAIYGLNASVL